jgi:hypothetical protein
MDSDASDQGSLVQQKVEGDRNQVIGQMLGGIVINQLTIHDQIPTAVAPPPISVAPSLTQQEQGCFIVSVEKLEGVMHFC